MAGESLPPQSGRIAFAAAGGGFGGALLAIIVAKLLSGPCCCGATVAADTPAAPVQGAEIALARVPRSG